MFIHIFEVATSILWLGKVFFIDQKEQFDQVLLYATTVRNFLSTILYITIILMGIWEDK